MIDVTVRNIIKPWRKIIRGKNMQPTKLTLGVFVLLLMGEAIVGNAIPKFKKSSPARFREAQTAYRMSDAKQVAMTLSGTMPLHDWTMTAHGLLGDASMDVTKDKQLIGITALTFSLPVRNLKGEQAAMDSDAYKSLKADRYPTIVFRLSSASIESGNNHNSSVLAHGNLTVAGVTREVVLSMSGNVANDGSITFTGSEQVKMSDYNVERPSILFGVIKAGDVMTLSYNLVFIR